MNDLREYSFSDWFWMFLKAIPAFLVAGFFIVFPIAALLTLAWLLFSF